MGTIRWSRREMIALIVGLTGCSRKGDEPGVVVIRKEPQARVAYSGGGYVITTACIGNKDTSCVDVCPVDVIHPRKEERAFAQATMLHIEPCACIQCGACVPACPVGAIYAADELPDRYRDDIKLAYETYGLDPYVTC